MKRLFSSAGIATLVAACAMALGVTAASAQAASAPTATKFYASPSFRCLAASACDASRVTATPDGAYTNCPAGDWCLFTGENGTGQRLATSSSRGTLGSFTKEDLSFANRTNGLVRMYFLVNGEGAWACVDSTKYRNVFQGPTDVFNNGPGDTGFMDPIISNIQSVNVASGSCQFPLPWP